MRDDYSSSSNLSTSSSAPNMDAKIAENHSNMNHSSAFAISSETSSAVLPEGSTPAASAF